MKILLAPLLLAVSLPAFAEVDPKIHKLCIEAKDYAGCVKAMKGETNQESEFPTTSRFIYGGSDQTGNSCPNGFAYSGASYCQKVKCDKGSGNNQSLVGKGWFCKKVLFMRGSLKWGDQTVKATYDSRCSNREPGIGWQNSCEANNPVGRYEW